jgi:hypothetical protein
VAVRAVVGNHGRVHAYPQARQQAQQLADSGDLAGARAVLEAVVDLGRPGLAMADPELLATMRQLAGLYTRDADPAAARRLLEEAYSAGQRIGPADPLMVLLAYDLAVVAEELDNRHEARRHFALVAEHGPAALGAEHPAVSRAREHAKGSAAEPSPSPPVSGSPVFGGAPTGGAPHSRIPWAIAATAVVVSIVLLVVVLVRPDAQPGDNSTPVAAAPSAAVPAPSATVTLSPTPTTSPTSARPKANAQATGERVEASRTTTTSRPATVVASRIVKPKTGSAVARRFPVGFTASAADVAATGTRLTLSVCVSEWCFLDGPVAFQDGKPEDYTVTLGSADGSDIGEKWTLRIDRLTPSTLADLQAHKQAAIDNGTWGNGVTTPIDRLNKTPVSSVVVTKTS